MQRCINQNAFFAHCGPVLIAMLCDTESLDNRKKAFETIVLIRQADELRSENGVKKSLRIFEPPEVDLAVGDYTQFVSFDDPSLLTEPPLTVGMELEELKAIVQDPMSFKLRYARAHNTTAERFVALSSEVNRSFPVGSPGRR